jgi:CelD/BcsL family acetyltransferase involved in cellulose biosynthesis
MATVEIQNRIEPLAAEWERLAQHTKATPFLWPGWVDAWWRALGAGQLLLLTAYENDQLVGVLPLRWLRGALTLIPSTHTRLSGFLAANEMVAKQLSYALFSQKPRRIDLNYVSPADAELSLACRVAEEAGYRVLKKSIPLAERVPYIAIEGTWDTFNSGLRRKFRSELRRRRRLLEKEGELTLEVSNGTERLDELLEEGFRIEGSGWKQAYGTSIDRRPALRRFYIEVARWAADHGWLRLAFLRLNGRALAFDYCLEYDNIHYLLRTGYDPAYGRFSPGNIIRYLMLARAFSERITIYDFCGEDWGWKRDWTSTVQERLFLRMFAPTVLGSLDQAVFVYASPASERARGLARSVLGERGRHVLKRGRGLVRERLNR